MRFWMPFLLIIWSLSGLGQHSGNAVFQTLNLPQNAKLAALGGEQITNNEQDVNLAIVNPSALHISMHNMVNLTYASYFAGIKHSNLSYIRSVEGLATFSANVNYLNYGDFTRTDVAGNTLGNFVAFDYSVQFGASKLLDSILYIGVNVKYLQSRLDDLKSNGIALDAGATYYSNNGLFSTSVLIKNAGIQLSKFSNNRARLPLNIQLGLTKKLAHAPFRFSLLLHNLQTPDLSLENSNLITTDPITDEVTKPDVSFGEKIMQHGIIGVEFIPSQVFNVRLGYNYKRRHDLRILDKAGTAGFSWGIGLKIANFKIDYGRATYHLAGGTNFISISKNF